MLSGRAMCRVNPDPVMQGRRGSPAERRKCALTAPDTSADLHCSAPFSALADINSILSAVRKLERSSGWKTGVQRITTDRLRFAISLRRQILTGTYRQQEENIFTVSERGHRRLIRALAPADMVLQHDLCDSVLIPALRKYLIYDNGASVKWKGMAFTRARLVRHLGEYCRHYGSEGFILQTDFAKFFDNIPHDRLVDAIDDKVRSPEIRSLLYMLLSRYAPDVSYTETDFDKVPFDSLKDSAVPPEEKTGRCILRRGIGIGAPISQVAGVFYPTPIDNYCKCVRGCKYYGRYMDDIYILHHDRSFLLSVLDGIRSQAHALGLFISERKTHIIPLRQGFTFCKIRYSFTPSGRLLMRPVRETFTRERRRLKRLYQLALCGKISITDYRDLYHSWRSNWIRFDCHRSLLSLDKTYRRYLDDLQH